MIHNKLLLHIIIWRQDWQFSLLSHGILSRALFVAFVWRHNCKDTLTIMVPIDPSQGDIKTNRLLSKTTLKLNSRMLKKKYKVTSVTIQMEEYIDEVAKNCQDCSTTLQ